MAGTYATIYLYIRIVLCWKYSIWYTNGNSKKTKNSAKNRQFYHFGKTLGKTHTANQHKQGVPEGKGENGTSPMKGIDTMWL